LIRFTSKYFRQDNQFLFCGTFTDEQIELSTSKVTDDFSQNLMTFFGIGYNTQEVFNKTSLYFSQQFLPGIPDYFYGYTNQTTNMLFAKNNANTLRIFIELTRRRENIDRLINSVKSIFSNLISFLNKNEIDYTNVSATILHEDEEILHGVYQSFGIKLKSTLFDLPAGIYLSVLMIIYSVLQLKHDGIVNKWEDAFTRGGIQLAVAIISIIIWIVVRMLSNKPNLSFKIKQWTI